MPFLKVFEEEEAEHASHRTCHEEERVVSLEDSSFCSQIRDHRSDAACQQTNAQVYVAVERHVKFNLLMVDILHRVNYNLASSNSVFYGVWRQQLSPPSH